VTPYGLLPPQIIKLYRLTWPARRKVSTSLNTVRLYEGCLLLGLKERHYKIWSFVTVCRILCAVYCGMLNCRAACLADILGLRANKSRSILIHISFSDRSFPGPSLFTNEISLIRQFCHLNKHIVLGGSLPNSAWILLWNHITDLVSCLSVWPY
jgi:hypothetical protein